MDESLQFKDGIALDSSRLRHEISAISICIKNKIPLEDDQLEFIQHICQSLYNFNSLKIKPTNRGRPTGTPAIANMTLYVYEAHLQVIEHGIAERKAISEVASLNNIAHKTLESAYYKEKKIFKHWSKEKQKIYMEAALAWYPLPEK